MRIVLAKNNFHLRTKILKGKRTKEQHQSLPLRNGAVSVIAAVHRVSGAEIMWNVRAVPYLLYG